jgi:hypothetical protein
MIRAVTYTNDSQETRFLSSSIASIQFGGRNHFMIINLKLASGDWRVIQRNDIKIKHRYRKNGSIPRSPCVSLTFNDVSFRNVNFVQVPDLIHSRSYRGLIRASKCSLIGVTRSTVHRHLSLTVFHFERFHISSRFLIVPRLGVPISYDNNRRNVRRPFIIPRR